VCGIAVSHNIMGNWVIDLHKIVVSNAVVTLATTTIMQKWIGDRNLKVR